MTINHTDQELLELILELEDELQAKGLDPKDRAFHLPIRAMEELGYNDFVLLGPSSDPLLERVHNLHKRFYRDKDIRSGGSHGGAFMFRGIAAMIHAPIIYGKKEINPWEWNDLKPDQRRWLQSNDEDHQAYLATCCGIFDFSLLFGPVKGSSSPPSDSVKLLTYVVQPKVPCWVQNWP